MRKLSCSIMFYEWDVNTKILQVSQEMITMAPRRQFCLFLVIRPPLSLSLFLYRFSRVRGSLVAVVPCVLCARVHMRVCVPLCARSCVCVCV